MWFNDPYLVVAVGVVSFFAVATLLHFWRCIR